MKKIIAAFALVLLSISRVNAQEEKPLIPTLNTENKQFEHKYIGEFNTTEIPVKTAYDRVLKYVYRTLQTDKSKVVTDEANNEIIFDCTLKASAISGFGYSIAAANFVFKVNIRVKEGKFRFFCNDFRYDYIENASNTQKYSSFDFGQLRNNNFGKKIKTEISSMLYQIQDDVSASIKSGNTESKKDDW